MSALEHILATSGAVRVDALKNEVALAKVKVDEGKAKMTTLLRDVYSVEARFVFTQGKTDSDIGVNKLAKKLAQEQSKKDVDVGPLTLTIDNVSLATFCTLLMLIYTGDIE
ncbi:hypothetical protein BG000_001312 [Podila horticola]|nr:hypothetical protein BG000_001312 [Podila horticola]